ncbi:MAG TPA: zinc ribbon domain-containing protein [Candidatus Nitrosocosmicus sp.]|nr:zinc ribbon domain-containing protein [Candidatus Nitrosocosmicus sp.]
METKMRCQSCGMPLGDNFYGTNRDSSFSTEYCKFCFKNGEFVNPNQTLEEMIELSINNMTNELNFSLETAQKLANQFIPQLNRWKKK